MAIITADSGVVPADTACVTVDGATICTVVLVGHRGVLTGAWLETKGGEAARKEHEKRKRQIWRSLEQTIEEAYAEATGQPRKAVRAEVKEALADRSPARVEAIAASLAQAKDPAAERLIEQITARLDELQAAAIIYERMELQARDARLLDEEEAIAAILMVI